MAAQVFECLRKLFVVGLFFFFGRGTIEQLVIGLLFCIMCLMIYNNVKPCMYTPPPVAPPLPADRASPVCLS